METIIEIDNTPHKCNTQYGTWSVAYKITRPSWANLIPCNVFFFRKKEAEAWIQKNSENIKREELTQ